MAKKEGARYAKALALDFAAAIRGSFSRTPVNGVGKQLEE